MSNVAEPAPSPAVLWYAADKAHPNDAAARTVRYLELMREAGHIVKAEPGQDHNLPCGWPGKRAGSGRISEGRDG